MTQISGTEKVKLYIETNLQNGNFWRNIKWFTNDMVKFCELNYGYSETADNYRRYLQTIREDYETNPNAYNFLIEYATKKEIEELKRQGNLNRSCLVIKFKIKLKEPVFHETLFD